MRILVTGIGTEVGKTVISAILTLGLDGEYWKPVQAGVEGGGDRKEVERLTGLPTDRFHPEMWRLAMPASPHAAAEAEGLYLDPAKLVVPATNRPLIIEGVGGWMVPFNKADLFADWAASEGLPTVLVSQHYLGSINHTLLSVEALLNRNVDLLGLIFNGEAQPGTESFLLEYTALPCLGRLATEERLNPQILQAYATDMGAAVAEAAGWSLDREVASAPKLPNPDS